MQFIYSSNTKNLRHNCDQTSENEAFLKADCKIKYNSKVKGGMALLGNKVI